MAQTTVTIPDDRLPELAAYQDKLGGNCSCSDCPK